MEEIKRGRVPWKRPVVAGGQPVAEAELGGANRAHLEKRRKLPRLVAGQAVAFRGNVLTGEALDARKDYPPFGYNPPPKNIVGLERRRKLVGPKYAPRLRPAQHPSAKHPLAALTEPKTRRAAMLQRLLNTNPLVRHTFERKTSLSVVLNGRTDGTISALGSSKSPAVSVSTQAMTNDAPSRDFLALMWGMEQEVMRRATELAYAQNQNRPTGGGSPSSSTFLGLPFGPGMGLFGNQSDQDILGQLGSTFGGFSSGSVSTDEAGGSIDVGAQKLALAVNRMNQMYSVISTMYTKYRESGSQAINNIK